MHPADSDRPRALALVSEKVAARFTLTAAEFVDRLMVLKQQRTREPAQWAEQLERLFLDDLYLATACAMGDERAWQEFDSRHFAFIRSFAARFLPRERANAG